MLMGELTHLRDTRAGKDLIAIGVEQGIEIGVEKRTLIGTVLICQKFLAWYQPSVRSLRSWPSKN